MAGQGREESTRGRGVKPRPHAWTISAVSHDNSSGTGTEEATMCGRITQHLPPRIRFLTCAA